MSTGILMMVMIWVSQIVASIVEPEHIGIIFMIAVLAHLLNSIDERIKCSHS